LPHDSTRSAANGQRLKAADAIQSNTPRRNCSRQSRQLQLKDIRQDGGCCFQAVRCYLATTNWQNQNCETESEETVHSRGTLPAIPVNGSWSHRWRFCNGWHDGFNHPLHGWDHLLAMLAVGLWAAQQRGVRCGSFR